VNATYEELLTAFELHSIERIRAVLDTGFDVRATVRGKTPVNSLVEMYTRSDRFPACLRLLLEHGAELDDPLLAPVLLDDAKSLTAAIQTDPLLLEHRTTLASAFTPLAGASLLHVAAEYGHLQAARVLLAMGAEVDARAAVDAYGLNGHTPLFHTVNSNGNRSAAVMRLLLEAGARSDLLLPGITWGEGFDWETTCFDVTPISYAQLGLLPQMHRNERDVYANVRALLQAANREIPPLGNLPNRYVHPKG
jgi:ankyrin repeat protein